MTSGSIRRSARTPRLTLPLRGSLPLPVRGESPRTAARQGRAFQGWVRGFRFGLALVLLALIDVSALTGGAEAAPAVEAEHGMVVSAQRYASEVGAGILAQGGNAIDAAVAVGYALAVVDPCCGNIGGGGFMTIHLKDGRDTFINFPKRHPLPRPPRCISTLPASRSTI